MKLKPLKWFTPDPDSGEFLNEDCELVARSFGGHFAIDNSGPNVLLWDAEDPFYYTSHSSTDAAKERAWEVHQRRSKDYISFMEDDSMKDNEVDQTAQEDILPWVDAMAAPELPLDKAVLEHHESVLKQYFSSETVYGRSTFNEPETAVLAPYILKAIEEACEKEAKRQVSAAVSKLVAEIKDAAK